MSYRTKLPSQVTDRVPHVFREWMSSALKFWQKDTHSTASNSPSLASSFINLRHEYSWRKSNDDVIILAGRRYWVFELGRILGYPEMGSKTEIIFWKKNCGSGSRFSAVDSHWFEVTYISVRRLT